VIRAVGRKGSTVDFIKGNKAIFAALLVNTVIAIMKFVVAAFSRSASLFSEAIHSTADTFNQIVLLIGKRTAKGKPNAKHPFGYARATFFASFCVAALLFFVGGAYSFMEAIEKITHTLNETGGHSLDMMALLVAAGILAVSIILEAFSLRTAFKEVKEEQEKEGSQSGLITFYRETRNSSLIVIVTEDLTAIIGLGLALVGVVLTLLTGNPLWDAIGGAAIGVLLIVAAFILGKEIASLIIGESLPENRLKQIEEVVLRVEHVSGFENLKTVAIGSNSILIEIDVVFAADEALSAETVMAAIVEVKQNVKALWQDQDISVSTCIEPVKAEL
jgi:cation diffusion facilitator family transporter